MLSARHEAKYYVSIVPIRSQFRRNGQVQGLAEDFQHFVDIFTSRVLAHRSDAKYLAGRWSQATRYFDRVLVGRVVDDCLPIGSLRDFDRCNGWHTIRWILHVHLQADSLQTGLQIRGRILVPANDLGKSFLANAGQRFAQAI